MEKSFTVTIGGIVPRLTSTVHVKMTVDHVEAEDENIAIVDATRLVLGIVSKEVFVRFTSAKAELEKEPIPSPV